MKKILYAAMCIIVVPFDAAAQSYGRCALRPAVGAALGFLTVDFPVDPVLADAGRFGLATTTGTGLEAAVNNAIPISREWSVTAEFGAGSMGVAQERDGSGTYGFKKLGDDVTIQRVQVGMQHHRPGRFTCGYAGIAAGVYRYNYRGVSLNVPGAAASVGLEAAHTRSGALFVEFGVSLALTELRTPTAAELVANLRPAVGYRYRF